MRFERMKEIREEKELKQSDIAEKLHVNRSTYAGWETCKILIQTSFIYEIAKKYNKSLFHKKK